MKILKYFHIHSRYKRVYKHRNHTDIFVILLFLSVIFTLTLFFGLPRNIIYFFNFFKIYLYPLIALKFGYVASL